MSEPRMAKAMRARGEPSWARPPWCWPWPASRPAAATTRARRRRRSRPSSSRARRPRSMDRRSPRRSSTTRSPRSARRRRRRRPRSTSTSSCRTTAISRRPRWWRTCSAPRSRCGRSRPSWRSGASRSPTPTVISRPRRSRRRSAPRSTSCPPSSCSRPIDRYAAFVALDQALAAQPTEEEMRKRVRRAPRRLQRACVRHILVATEAEANTVLANLRGGADFAAEAAQHPIDEAGRQ